MTFAAMVDAALKAAAKKREENWVAMR